jgi:hypothetical protein
MNPWATRLRKPVRRHGAEFHMLLTLLSFAASVSVTRLMLSLTGFPQLGTRQIHIAHVLWGGLLLFVAALLPLIYANRWVYSATALLAGVGIGLFIDEVGKFITQTNDYFYPPAAPIIYAFFLLTVLLYYQIRRRPTRDARAEMYHALDMMEEVLDRDLNPDERIELAGLLGRVSRHARTPELAHLAEILLQFIQSEGLHMAPELPGFLERWAARWAQFERRWLGRSRLKTVLGVSLAVLGALAMVRLGQLLAAAFTRGGLERVIAELLEVGRVSSAAGLAWFSARTAFEGVVGLLTLAAALLFLLGLEKLGVGLGILSLLLSLTAVNLLVFYFDQFSTIALALAQFIVLVGLYHFRRHHRPR